MKTKRTKIFSGTPWEPLAGYARAVQAGDTVHVSGTTGTDPSGKVLARGIAFVAGSIPARSDADFSARVPNVAGTTGFRVGVSSFRFGLGRSESP